MPLGRIARAGAAVHDGAKHLLHTIFFALPSPSKTGPAPSPTTPSPSPSPVAVSETDSGVRDAMNQVGPLSFAGSGYALVLLVVVSVARDAPNPVSVDRPCAQHHDQAARAAHHPPRPRAARGHWRPCPQSSNLPAGAVLRPHPGNSRRPARVGAVHRRHGTGRRCVARACRGAALSAVLSARRAWERWGGSVLWGRSPDPVVCPLAGQLA